MEPSPFPIRLPLGSKYSPQDRHRHAIYESKCHDVTNMLPETIIYAPFELTSTSACILSRFHVVWKLYITFTLLVVGPMRTPSLWKRNLLYAVN